jgi:hypothetical protein
VKSKCLNYSERRSKDELDSIAERIGYCDLLPNRHESCPFDTRFRQQLPSDVRDFEHSMGDKDGEDLGMVEVHSRQHEAKGLMGLFLGL